MSLIIDNYHLQTINSRKQIDINRIEFGGRRNFALSKQQKACLIGVKQFKFIYKC